MSEFLGNTEAAEDQTINAAKRLLQARRLAGQNQLAQDSVTQAFSGEIDLLKNCGPLVRIRALHLARLQGNNDNNLGV